jgi:hypothetical protein
MDITRDRTTADNRRLAQWRLTWLIEHSTSHQHLWCIDSFVLRNPPLRQAPKRYTAMGLSDNQKRKYIRFAWLSSQTGKNRETLKHRNYSRLPAPGSPFRLDLIHEKNFFVSVLHQICFENYFGGI